MSAAAGNDSRKRSKKRYVAGHHNKRWKGSRELEVGMQGILITCNMNERKCTTEAFNLLNEYAETLYGPEKASKYSHFTKYSLLEKNSPGLVYGLHIEKVNFTVELISSTPPCYYIFIITVFQNVQQINASKNLGKLTSDIHPCYKSITRCNLICKRQLDHQLAKQNSL